MRRRAAPAFVAALALILVMLAGTPAPARTHGRVSGGSGIPRPPLPALPAPDPSARSLSPAGRQLVETHVLDQSPRYALSAAIDPATGVVDGAMRARLPYTEAGDIHFRLLPGLPALDTGLRLAAVTVDGRAVPARVDRMLLTLVGPGRVPDRRFVEVRLRFRYRVPDVEHRSPPGMPLTAATIHLLGRDQGLTDLGHWFPIWMPPGADIDPDPHGSGDIANFAAGEIAARVRVPRDVVLVSGGVNTARTTSDGTTTYTEEGVGLRDLAMVLGPRLTTRDLRHGDVTIRATGSSAAGLDDATKAAADSLDTYDAAFGPYPWSELDLVMTPLGAGVGGVEWPGIVWLEPGSDAPTVAHEVGHQWWHALVGNDSIRVPVVDEPLANFSMCLETGHVDGDAARQRCDQSFASDYREMRASGTPDTRADQSTPSFSSTHQYVGIIYGKAASFYPALEARIGTDAMLAGLRSVASRFAFKIATPNDLRESLAAASPEHADEVRALWDEWMEQANGDAELGR